MRKTPMLVKKVPNRNCDFQWPYEEDLKRMMEGKVLKLSQIEVWHTEHGALGGIRVTLNNGEQSPYYKCNGTSKDRKVIKINQENDPAAIHIITREYTTNALKITDRYDKPLSNEWVGINDAPYTKTNLKVGDQIVGIYGGRKG